MILTRNQIIKIFSDFAEAHDIINDFGYGDTSEIGTTRQMKFPYMWVYDDATSIDTIHQTKNQTALHGFIITFLDQENEQENFDNNVGFNSDNRQELMSDMFQLCQDFVTFIQTQGHEWGLSLTDGSVTADRTYDETTDKSYGWFINVELRTKHFNCDLPGDFDGVNPFPPCPPTPCDPATVENSDATYTNTVASGDTLVLPDINVTINGDDQGNFASVQDLALTYTCPPASCPSRQPLKTGQVTSYASNDDGALQLGRGVDFVTLNQNNPFGNTNRFTDELGGQTFANSIFIDWSSDDSTNELVLGYTFGNLQGIASKQWAAWMSGQPYSAGGYNDWYVANKKQAQALVNEGVTQLLNYAPINNGVVNGATVQYTSTTRISNTAQCWMLYIGQSEQWQAKTIFNSSAILVRYYTYTELGL